MSTVDLRNILIKTLEDLGGSSKILPICRHAWTNIFLTRFLPKMIFSILGNIEFVGKRVIFVKLKL